MGIFRTPVAVLLFLCYFTLLCAVVLLPFFILFFLLLVFRILSMPALSHQSSPKTSSSRRLKSQAGIYFLAVMASQTWPLFVPRLRL